MAFSSETAARLAEALSHGVRELAGGGEYREPEEYFAPDELRPTVPGYFDAFDRINGAFTEWLDPGEVGPPDPSQVRQRRRILRFPSPLPTGHPDVDRVVLKVYRTPAGAPEVGVLFHHWLGMSNWLTVDWILRPLTRRYRVAAMVAPHHGSRRIAGRHPGEGFVNPNPRHLLEGFRQWQADHLASLALLRRDCGFARTVVAGYSLGGYGALLHRLIRPPLPTVAICTTNNYARGVFEGEYTAALARRLRQAGFTPESLARATRSLHLARWGSRIAGRELTWIYARHDYVEPPESLREARLALAPERVVELEGGHSTALLDHGRIVDEIAGRVERLLGG